MTKNSLIVSHTGNSIQLFWQRGQSAPRSAPSMTFEHPFDSEALAELRWYLEEYLRFPYGLEPEKAKKTEQKFQIWGQQLFDLVFPRTTKAWDFFQEATREGLDQCELCISSDDPAILNLPWELLYNSDYQFLAPSLAGMYRSINEYAVRAEMPNLPQDRLNILLVIARPYGEKDIALRTIARPLLEALKPIQKQVNLKVLRPPSFEQFERELNDRKGFYHIVHFDGHGNFDPKSKGFQHSLGGQGQGVLVFENSDGSPQIVTAAQIAQSLTDCRVPIFMLNACKSAQEGEGSFSSVATRLVTLGAKGVVAMAYSVYAEAAKHFIGRVYEQLVRGSTLSAAVAAGRREILNRRQRPSPKGNLPLQDWLIPVLYQQETYTPYIPANDRVLDINSFLEEDITSKLIEFPEEGAYGFVGRDYDLLQLERSLRQNPIVLLRGMAGVGKTQLACGFAHWVIETQGRSLCFFQSFEHGANLANVIYQVGRVVWGDNFSQYNWEQQQTAVLNYLKIQPCLLVWDNFEPIAGFPTGSEPLLPKVERESLKQFLQDLRGGQSQVLITSRQEEPWLGCGYTLQVLSGLAQVDAEEFARKLLKTIGIDHAKLPSEYLSLLKILNGHPLSLQVVLPYLKNQSPAQVIEALEQGFSTFEEQVGLERDKSLIVSLDYSFTRLSDKANHHLPFLGLFSTRFNASFIADFSSGFGTEDSFKSQEMYQSFFGEALERKEWFDIINEAVDVGLLEEIEQNLFRLHPTLPWYLRQRLLKYQSSITVDELENWILLFYIMQGILLAPEYNGDSVEQSISILLFEEPNLLQYMRYAERKQDWNAVWSIFTGLGDVYNRLGLWNKFNSLRQHLARKLGSSFAQVLSKGEGALDLYIFIQGAEAYDAVRLGDFERARRIHQEILDELLRLDQSSVKEKIAIAYYNLAIVAIEQRDFDKATESCQEAIKVYKEVDEPSNKNFISKIYIQLGIVRRTQGYFEKADHYFQKSVQLAQKYKDLYQEAEVYYHLAELSRAQENLEISENYCKNAIQMYQDFDDISKVAASYDLMGMILRESQKYQQSISYYRKALQIYEDGQDEYNASDEYQGLGQVFKSIGQLDDAVVYFEKALQIRSKFQVWYKVAGTLVELGETLELQSNFVRALSCYINTFAIDVSNGKEHVGSDMQNLARMLKQLGEELFKEIWREVTKQDCPNEIYIALRKLNN